MITDESTEDITNLTKSDEYHQGEVEAYDTPLIYDLNHSSSSLPSIEDNE